MFPRTEYKAKLGMQNEEAKNCAPAPVATNFALFDEILHINKLYEILLIFTQLLIFKINRQSYFERFVESVEEAFLIERSSCCIYLVG